MKKLALLAVLLSIASRAFAAGAGCSNTSGPLTLEKVRAGASGTEMFGCINRSLDVLSSSAVYSGTGSTATFKLLRVGQITGLSGGGGVWVSSNVTVTSSMTLTGDIWLGGTIRSSVTMADAMSALTGSFGSSAVRPLPLAVMVTSTYGFSAGNLLREVRIGQYPGTDEPAIQGFKNNDQSNIVLNLNPDGGTVVVGGLGLYSSSNTLQSNGPTALNSSMLVGGPSSFSGSLTARSSMTLSGVGGLLVSGPGGITSAYGVKGATFAVGVNPAGSIYEPLVIANWPGATGLGLYSVAGTQAFWNLYDGTAFKWGIIKQATPFSLDFNNGNSVKVLSLAQDGTVTVPYGVSAATGVFGGGICPSTASVCLNTLPLAANAGAYFGGNVGFSTTTPAAPIHAYVPDGSIAAYFGSPTSQLKVTPAGTGITILQPLGGTTATAGTLRLQKLGTVSAGLILNTDASITIQTEGEVGANGRVFKVENSTFNILNNGKVGIGTSSPNSILTVNGSADFVGSVGIGTTNPLAKLDVAGGIGTYSRTAAQLEAITPTAAGQIYYCSDCSNAVHVVVSTGSAVCQFDAFIGGTAWH